VSRVAPNFFRFGSFEVFLPGGPSEGNEKLKKALLDHVIQYYPAEIADMVDETERYLAFFKEIVKRTAILAAQWQAIGISQLIVKI
jgi:uncharacterized protein YdiU (UPF0061 family)